MEFVIVVILNFNIAKQKIIDQRFFWLAIHLLKIRVIKNTKGDLHFHSMLLSVVIFAG